MSRIAYVNGRYLPHSRASVHIEDRGYQFADGVYEVMAVHGGRLLDEEPHLRRLARSLHELGIAAPVSDRVLRHVGRRLIRLNRLRNGMLYLQITRGVAPRDHGFPTASRPQLVMTAKRIAPPKPQLIEEGVKVITIPDQRWARCDIKSISLLPNVLGKQAAREVGAYEAWQVEEGGLVTEGTSSNAWIVDADGELVTRPTGDAILSGVVRSAVLALARELDLPVDERAFSVEEAKRAREAFMTSTTSLVLPVTQIDDSVVANGRPGSVSLMLRERLSARLGCPA